MPFDPAKYSRQEQGFDPARYSAEPSDTMALESLLGAAPQAGELPIAGDAFGLTPQPSSTAAMPAATEQDLLLGRLTEDPIIKRTTTEILAGKKVAPYSLRALKGAYRYMTSAVVPQQGTVPKELLRHAANIATTPARFAMAFPEFVASIVKADIESAKAMYKGEPSTAALELGGQLVEPLVSAAKYPFTGDPEDYAKATHDPAMTVLPVLMAMGLGMKGRGVFKGKAKTKIVPTEAEILGAEKPAVRSDIIPKKRIPTERVPTADELLGAEKPRVAAQVKDYKVAGDVVDGRTVRKQIPNQESISSTLEGDYKVLPGIREVPMSEFEGITGKHYSVQGNKKIAEIAKEISKSNEIDPLIVVVDSEGAYILEGATRVDALFRLKAKSFPAQVVLDESVATSLKPVTPKPKAKAAGEKTERRQFFGTRDKVDRGEITAEDARAGKLPEVTEPKPIDPYKFAGELKSKGIGRQESYSRWVQRTSLRPGMDAKDWFAIYDRAIAVPKKPAPRPAVAKAKAPAPRGKVKEPWEMTAREYASGPVAGVGKKQIRAERLGMERRHRDIVSKALSENKPVPAEVLKDYPELKSQVATSKKKVSKAEYEKKQPSRVALYKDEYQTYEVSDLSNFGEPRAYVQQRTLKKAIPERPSDYQVGRSAKSFDDAVSKLPKDAIKIDDYIPYEREILGITKPKAPPPRGAKVEVAETDLRAELKAQNQQGARWRLAKNPKYGEQKITGGKDVDPFILRGTNVRGRSDQVIKGNAGFILKTIKPSERGAALNIPREIARPSGAEPVKYKEAIKAPDRPEMTNMESYYKSISTQKKLTPDQAVKKGIALKTTKGLKVKPAIREAGTFVPSEFSTYESFKDAKPGVFGGTKDWIRYVQEIDGALSLQKKAKLPGQSGPAEKYILRRQEDMVKLELDWSAEQSLRIKEITKGLNKKQERLVTQVLEETSRPGSYVKTTDFATNTRIKKITTDTKVVRAAQESRKALEHWFSQQNKLRVLRNQELINYREYYAPHILREASLWERAFGKQFEPKEVVQGPGLPDYIKPNKPFNPRELAREVGLKDYMREMQIGKILEDYANTASRDIHHTSIIQNNKAFIQQLETMGYKNAAEGVSNYTAESFGGVKAWMDRGARLPTGITKSMRFWRGSLMRSVFPLNIPWNAFVQTLSSGLTVMRTGVTNSTRGLMDWFANPTMRNRIKSAYSFRVKSQRAGRITHQDINTGLTKMISGKRSTWQAAIDGTNYFTELVERELTGWSIASGLRHGAKRGLKGKALWDYASDTGAKTQSMYNLENKPGILRSEIVQTAQPFQTFIFEMYNTAREFAGKTGTPPGAITERIGWVLRFTAMAYAGNEISHAVTGRRPWEIYSFIPFSDQTIKPVIDKLRGKPYDAMSGRGLPSFVGAGVEFAGAVRSYLRTGDTRKIRNWGIKYGTAFMKIPGGTQTARMVDGWIAVADGKMKDSRGKTLFKIKDPWEQARAVTMGPWRTKAGIEYWDKKETGILEDIGIVKPKKKALSPWEVMGGVGKTKKRKKDVDFSKYLGAE